jgi:hypothetical protein
MYLSLFSNSGSIRAGDTIANFETELNSTVDLSDGEYECALLSASLPTSFEVIIPETAYMSVKTNKYNVRINVDLEIPLISSDSDILEIVNTYLKKDEIELQNVEGDKYRFVPILLSKKKYVDVMLRHDGLYFEGDLELVIGVNEIFELKQQLSGIPMSGGVSKIKIIVFNKASESRSSETRVELDGGIRNLKHLVYSMNKKLNKFLHTEVSEDIFSIHGMYVRYNGFRASIGKTSRHDIITLSEQLVGILGFNFEDVFSVSSTVEASRFSDFTSGFKYAIISSPIVENQFVGNDSIPILGIIPLEKANNTTMIYFEPRHLAYKRVVNKELSTIRISACNETGSLLKYMLIKTYPLVITLHLRKRQNGG